MSDHPIVEAVQQNAGPIAQHTGNILWSGSAVMMWLNQNVDAVVALTAIGGFILSIYGVSVRRKHLKELKRENELKEKLLYEKLNNPPHC